MADTNVTSPPATRGGNGTNDGCNDLAEDLREHAWELRQLLIEARALADAVEDLGYRWRAIINQVLTEEGRS